MKTIAFYLPQFHRFPENDEWWGEGFTEWTNVKKAKPLFEGHYQPRVPLNNNYYNLLDLDTLKWQADIANKYGVYGFCFYHYWFSGKLLMEKPLNMFLSEKSIDIHFCFCWANETWTKAWASKNDTILIKQEYGKEEEWESHFNYLLGFFRDDRYIKIKNKPLLVIYRPENIDCLRSLVEFWNALAIKNGFDGLELYYQQVDFYYKESTDKDLFSHHIEYEPAYYRMFLNRKKSVIRSFIGGLYFKIFKKNRLRKNQNVTRLSFDDAWKYMLEKKAECGAIPCAMVGWDNTPRRGEKGSVFDGSTPSKFESYFSRIVHKTRAEYKEDMLFVFAWNEWAEGGYLEPDEKYGYGYLEAIRNALLENNEFPNENDN